MATPEDILLTLKDIQARLNEIQGQPVSGQHVHTIGGLSEIDKNLGLVTAGEFRTGNGLPPGKGFTGVRMGFPAFSYAGDEWNVVGVNADALEFGLSAIDGKAYFGTGTNVLDSEGLHISTLNDSPFFDGSSSGSNTNGTASTTLSWAHTVPSGYDNQIISIQVAIRGGVDVDGITWTPSGGSAEDAVYVLAEQPGSDIRTEIWYVLAPTVGAGTIEVTLTSSQNMAAHATGLWNVDQTTPVDWSSGNGGPSVAWLEILTGSMAVGELVISALGSQVSGGTYCIPWRGILYYDDMTGQTPGLGVSWTLPTSDLIVDEVGWLVDYPHYAVDALAGVAVAYASAGELSTESMTFSDTGLDIQYGYNNFNWKDSADNVIADLNLSGDVVSLRGANSLVLQSRVSSPMSRVSMYTAGAYASYFDIKFNFEFLNSGSQSYYLLTLGIQQSTFNLLNNDINFGVGAYRTYGYEPYKWGIYFDAGLSKVYLLWDDTKDTSNGTGVIYIGNRYQTPTTDPESGGVLYAESGALKWRGSSGTVTTIASA